MLWNVSSPNKSNNAMLMNGTIESYCNVGPRDVLSCVSCWVY